MCEEKLLHEQAFSYQSCTAVDESSKPLNSGALPQMYSQCDLRDKHILSLELLMESGKTIHLQFDSKTIFDRCLHTIRSVIAYNKRSRGYPDLVHAWPVSVKHRTRNHSSSRFLPTSRVKQYLCLTPSEVLLTHGCLRTPTLVSSYSHIRECSSRMDGRFSLNLGRASPVGECVLILRLANGTQAAFAHKVLFKLMRQFSALHRSGHNDGCIDGTQSEYNSFSLLPLPPLVTADLPQTADRDEPENKARRNGSHCPGDLESKWVGNNCEALGPIFLTWPRRSQDHLSVDVGRKPVQRAVTNPEMRNIEMIPSSNVQSFNHASGGKVRNSELLEAHYLQMDCPNEDTSLVPDVIVRQGNTPSNVDTTPCPISFRHRLGSCKISVHNKRISDSAVSNHRCNEDLFADISFDPHTRAIGVSVDNAVLSRSCEKRCISPSVSVSLPNSRVVLQSIRPRTFSDVTSVRPPRFWRRNSQKILNFSRPQGISVLPETVKSTPIPIAPKCSSLQHLDDPISVPPSSVHCSRFPYEISPDTFYGLKPGCGFGDLTSIREAHLEGAIQSRPRASTIGSTFMIGQRIRKTLSALKRISVRRTANSKCGMFITPSRPLSADPRRTVHFTHRDEYVDPPLSDNNRLSLPLVKTPYQSAPLSPFKDCKSRIPPSSFADHYVLCDYC
ncbi:unnamed protein product [Calicophoron daubneyi]